MATRPPSQGSTTVLNVRGPGELPGDCALRRLPPPTSAPAVTSEAYSGGDTMPMHIVVQAMVDARAAGVVFTADPVSARRDLLIPIDAVAGLGEALVSGEATPRPLRGTPRWRHRATPVNRRSGRAERPGNHGIAVGRAAAAAEGHPLDLSGRSTATAGFTGYRPGPSPRCRRIPTSSIRACRARTTC
ncbi:MAG: PEP/pyruvate-binding domain-containing protein [Halioglobus sp.]